MRKKWIDSLKGIAILGVVIIHAGGSNLPGILGKIGTSGLFGVQLFFMLSAFLTWHSLERIHYTYIEWIKKKLFRLLPEYYVAYFFAIIVFGFPSLINLIVHILGIWGFFPQYSNCTMAEWYLGALIIFYLLSPMIYKFVNTFGRACIAFLTSVFVSFGIQKLLRVLLIDYREDYSVNAYIGNTSIWAQLPSLLLGVVLYYIVLKIDELFTDNNITERNESRRISFFLLAISIIFIAGLISGKNNIWGLSVYAQYTIGFVGIALSQNLYCCKALNNCFFSFLGGRSYSIYLFHYSIIKMCNSVFNLSNDLLGFALKVIVSISASLFISYFYSLIKERLSRVKNDNH